MSLLESGAEMEDWTPRSLSVAVGGGHGSLVMK